MSVEATIEATGLSEGDATRTTKTATGTINGRSAETSCVAVVARTDPSEQESVILLPELDGINPKDYLALELLSFSIIVVSGRWKE
jgi:hypothetical protein